MNEDILLDLSTDRKREKIAIDGTLYEMQTPQDFQLQEYQWLAKQGERIQELSGPGLTSANLPKLAKLLDRVVVKIMRSNMPRRVLRKLSNPQKIEIMNAFTKVARIREETTRPGTAGLFSSKSLTRGGVIQFEQL